MTNVMHGTFATIAGAPQPNPTTGCGTTKIATSTNGTFYAYDTYLVTGGVFDPFATCNPIDSTGCHNTSFFPQFFGNSASYVEQANQFYYTDGANTMSQTMAQGVSSGAEIATGNIQ